MKLRSPSRSSFTKDRLLALWRREVRPLLILGTCLFAARSSFADWNFVPTGSMKPTILEGDRVLVNKLAYDLKVPFTTWHLAEWAGPQRNDVIVFYSPADETRLVKRVIGLPGDIIEMRRGRLFINHEPVRYAPLDSQIPAQLGAVEQNEAAFASERLGEEQHAVMALPRSPAVRDFGPLCVAEDSYFVLGDNRDNRADSRFFGTVQRRRVVGKVTTVIASFDPENWHLPRANRWFRPLDE